MNNLKLIGLFFSICIFFHGQIYAQSDNTTVGFHAGESITTGDKNSFFGTAAGRDTDAGNNNTFFGYFSGTLNTSGNYNTFSGYSAGLRNITSDYNTFSGAYAGKFNNSGSRNTSFGSNAGQKNSSGIFNTNMGSFSGYYARGSYNTNIGGYAGYNSSGGTRNSYIGYQAGYYNTNGDANTFFGYQSGRYNTGTGNVFIGKAAGFNIAGDNQLCFANTSSGNLIFGDFSSNQVTINTTSLLSGKTFYVNGSSGGTSYWGVSDKRYKTDIQKINSPIEMLNEINGVSYAYKTNEFGGINFDEGRTYGVLAQEVKIIFPELVSEGEDGYNMVNYDGLVPVLIEAIKERQIAIDKLREELKNFSTNTANTTNNQLEIENVVLEQNKPNPFSENTIIKYHLPESVNQASIYIYDLQGKQLKNIPIQQLGDGQIEINANEFQPGLFTYVLVVDGQIAATKKMIITE